MIYTFKSKTTPTLAELGGKGLSLVKMIRASLPVPPGFVLSVKFFTPWLMALRATPEWKAVQTAIEKNADLHLATTALKDICRELSLSGEQEHALKDAIETLPKGVMYAVRSSSPEEDLEGASFAGGYKTSLGVTGETLLEAIHASFASAFDERVFVYKKQQGFDTDNPRIAVIIQQQIASEIAGVGFSLNPVNNDYDEAVIDANWGLGESVVTGMASPDHFIVDKVEKSFVEKQLGTKETAVWLHADGGVEERPNHKKGEFCISDEQVLEITELLTQIETLYNKPIDIEWAFADEKVYLLQARPITAYIPLPEEMLTLPGDRRILYWDAGLSDGVTINRPMSPLTIDWLFVSLGVFATPFLGPIDIKAAANPATSLIFGTGGRLYLNLSQFMTVYSLKRIANDFQSAEVDVLLSELLANVDVDRYKAWKKIDSLAWGNLLLFIPKILWYSRIMLGRTISALWNPDQYFEFYEPIIKTTIRELKLEDGQDRSLKDFVVYLNEKLTPVMGEVALPGLMPYLFNFMTIDKKFGGDSEENRQLVDSMKMGFAGNEAVDIGVRLFRMSKMLTPADFSDLPQLAERLRREELPENFHAAWNEFVEKYGMRGPGELELSNARYGDDPLLGLEQMSYMAEATFDPEQMQQQRIAERQQAYETLHSKLIGPKQAKLERTYKILDLLGGARDTPKYLWVMENGAVRRRALVEGEKFFKQGRLEKAEDIFWLTLAEIEKANVLSIFDLRTIIESRKPFYRLLERVVAFPHLIDSRGRIGQVPLGEKGDPNTLVGLGISRGVATGRIKVLHEPREKPIEKGDVLVAYTTDPGWTPLFVNAEAVILEVGGMLQHGGVVAREFGKPCVAGIQGITTKLQDGQLVEVDGTTGVVRILEE